MLHVQIFCFFFSHLQNKLISIKFLCQMLWNLKPLRIYNSFVRYDEIRGYLSNFPKAVIVDASCLFLYYFVPRYIYGIASFHYTVLPSTYDLTLQHSETPLVELN